MRVSDSAYVDGRLIVPRPMLYFDDETKYWEECNPAIVERTGRIYGVYLFDERKAVHLCEITPSYEMEFLQSTMEYRGYPEGPFLSAEMEAMALDAWERERDELQDYLYRGDVGTEQWSYTHCFKVEPLIKPRGFFDAGDGRCCIELGKPKRSYWKKILREHDGSYEEAHRALMEEYREHVQCNGYY